MAATSLVGQNSARSGRTGGTWNLDSVASLAECPRLFFVLAEPFTRMLAKDAIPLSSVT
jgi:hypothetical protein